VNMGSVESDDLLLRFELYLKSTTSLDITHRPNEVCKFQQKMRELIFHEHELINTRKREIVMPFFVFLHMLL
jgi:hypothetical protein